MKPLTQADWVLIRLLSVAYYARCVDPMLTDAYCYAEFYLEKKIGNDLLNCAMYTVKDDAPRSFVGYGEATFDQFILICTLWDEICHRGDTASKRHHDMHATNKWLNNLHFV